MGSSQSADGSAGASSTDASTEGGMAVRVRDLRVVRGGRAVIDGLSLTVASGQIVGLLGPSGCGKTTLMRCLVGVQQVAGGTVEVLGTAAGSAALRRQIGYLTQAPSVYTDLSVRQNLRYFAAVIGLRGAALRARVEELVESVDLRDRADHQVEALSGGERSRVSLAVALVGSPDLLVLDEPTVGLDPVLRRDLWRLFRTLADRGVTLIVSSHVMDEALRCDRLLLMRDGALLADDTVAGVLAATGADSIEQAFLTLVETGPTRGTA